MAAVPRSSISLRDMSLFREQAFVGGGREGPANSQVKEGFNPTTGQLIGTVPNLGAAETRRALEAAEKALDQALVSGASHLRVIHGHGTGRLREGIREHFRNHGAVASQRSGSRTEGGNGATILELR